MKSHDLPKDTQNPSPDKAVAKDHSLKLNAISNWGPLFVNILIGLFLIPFIIDGVGKTDYGIWALVASFVGYYGFLRLGIPTALMRYIPYHSGRGDKEKVNEVLSTALLLFTVISITVTIVSFVLARFVADFYDSGTRFIILFRIIGLVAAVECVMRVFDAAVRARERWVIANLIQMLSSVLRAVGWGLCVYLGYGIIGMGSVLLGVTLLSLIMAIIVFVKIYPEVKISISRFSVKQVKLLIVYGFLATITALLFTTIFQFHNLIIGKMISLEAVAVYAVTILLIKNVRALVVRPNSVFWPRFAHLDGSANDGTAGSLLQRATKYNTLFASGIILVLATTGASFIQLWMGDGFEGAHLPLLILSIACLAETSFAVLPPLMGGTGRQHIMAVMALVEGSIGITASIFLGAKFGLAGIALGFAISLLIIRGFICPLYICRVYKIKFVIYYWSVLKIWLLAGLLFAIGYFINVNSYINSWLILIGFVVLIECLYLLCIYFLMLTKSDKEKAGIMIAGIIKKFRRNKA